MKRSILSGWLQERNGHRHRFLIFHFSFLLSVYFLWFIFTCVTYFCRFVIYFSNLLFIIFLILKYSPFLFIHFLLFSLFAFLLTSLSFPLIALHSLSTFYFWSFPLFSLNCIHFFKSRNNLNSIMYQLFLSKIYLLISIIGQCCFCNATLILTKL